MADFIRQHHSSLAAIGEVGLDYWVVKEAPDKAVQREILKRFIELAQELDLPLNVHSRSAGRHAIALLLENNAARVQMHAFDGKAGAALLFNPTFRHPFPPETETGQAVTPFLSADRDRQPGFGPLSKRAQ
jgi:hypothetical protein